MTRVYVDTNVFLYAFGGEHPYREPGRRIVQLIADSRLAGEWSVEVVQEFLHIRLRRIERSIAVQQAEHLAMLCPELHDFEHRDLTRALELANRNPQLVARDAVHAATALNRGIDTIVSADRHFDAIPRLERIDPADTAALEKLAR